MSTGLIYRLKYTWLPRVGPQKYKHSRPLHQNSIVEVSKNLIENPLNTSKLDFYIQNGLPQRKLIKDRHGPEKQLTRLLSLFQNYS